MPFTTWASADLMTAAKLNNDNTIAVATDTARTITVTHTWTAAQTFTGGWTAAAACTISSGGIAVTGNSTVAGTVTITSAGAAAFGVGLNGATNPAFNVDASTGSQAAGLNVTGATSAGTVAVAVISSGAAASLSLDAKSTGTITVGGTSTGAVQIGSASNIIKIGAPATIVNANSGEMILAKTKGLRSANNAGTSSFTLIQSNTSDEVVLGDGSSAVHIGYIAAAGLGSGASARDGVIAVDSTNNRFVFYSGGTRYYINSTGSF